MKSTDFSPIAEQGELELDTGLLSRLRRRREVAPVASGYVRILLDEHGEPIEQVSAGQKYWSHARGWVKIDIRTHSLEYQLPFDDPSGVAGFVATVTVSAGVVDAQEAVKEGADGVEEILKPPLRDSIRHALGKVVKATEYADTVAEINALAVAADQQLESIVGRIKAVPKWLEAKVIAVSVELDEATKSHREELVKRRRAVALTEADSMGEVAKEEGVAKVRNIRRRSIGNLGSPEQRALERLAADSSPENVERVMSGLDDSQAEGRAAFIQMLRDAMEKDFFDKGDPLHQMLSAMGPNVLAEIAGASAPALKAGEGDNSDAKIIDAEVETVESETEDEDGDGDEEDEDRDWSS